MADEFEPRSQAFLNWLTAQSGASINPKIKLVDYRERGAGRGVQAIQDIAADEDLFSIPRSSILSLDNSDLKTQISQYFEKNGESEDNLAANPFAALNLVLIYEFMLGQQSRWKAYFDILPNHFDTLMFWSEEELEYLQSSAVVDKIGRSAADELFDNVLIPIIRRHETVFKTAVEMSDQQLKDLAHRMGSIIMSYAFDIEKEDDEDEADEDGYATDDEEQVSRGMVPLADLLNADAEPNASLFQSTDILTMKSLKPIPARTEVLNDYGQLPRSDLLRRYGYITPSYAKFDCVEVSRRLLNKHMTRDRENINRENRLIYLLEKEILEDNYDIVWPENSENMDFFPDDLSRYVKAMLTSEDKYKNVAKTGASDDSLLLLFKTTMKLVVHARMSEYPTSIAQDLKTLADQDLDIRQKMAIEVRLGEKNLLEAASARLSEDDQPQNNGRAQSNGEPASKKRRT